MTWYQNWSEEETLMSVELRVQGKHNDKMPEDPHTMLFTVVLAWTCVSSFKSAVQERKEDLKILTFL